MSEPGKSLTTKLKDFKAELKLREGMIVPMLPAHIPVDRFMVAIQTAVANQPELLDVYRPSLLKACVESAELGLSLNPNLKESDVLIVWNNRASRKEAQLRPRYGGFIKLANQSGAFKCIGAEVVREGDSFDYELGLNKDLRHKPAPSNRRGEIIGAYCWWELANGIKDFEYMDRAELDKIRSRTTSKNKAGDIVGPWVTDAEQMFRKTPIRRASKFWPLSADDRLRTALELDNHREFNDDKGVTIDHETGEVIYEEDETSQPPRPTEAPVERKGSKASQKLDDLVTQPPASDEPRPTQAPQRVVNEVLWPEEEGQ